MGSEDLDFAFADNQITSPAPPQISAKTWTKKSEVLTSKNWDQFKAISMSKTGHKLLVHYMTSHLA